MEIILAIVVASAVVFFGALISMGNERQRRAIDNLHEQVSLWAIQDLTIKRETLARDVRVEDPILWLNELTEKYQGIKLTFRLLKNQKTHKPFSVELKNQIQRFCIALTHPKILNGLEKHQKTN